MPCAGTWTDTKRVPRARPPAKSRRRLRKNRLGLTVDDATSVRLGRIRQKGTTPEQAVRKLLTSLGVAYRLNNRDLPGTPDIANRSKQWAIFVNGCFWHRHVGCARATTPTRNRSFWLAKFSANTERDRTSLARLKRIGYRTLVIWECKLSESPVAVREVIRSVLLRPAGRRPRLAT